MQEFQHKDAVFFGIFKAGAVENGEKNMGSRKNVICRYLCNHFWQDIYQSIELCDDFIWDFWDYSR